jgi:hypothetical protein
MSAARSDALPAAAEANLAFRLGDTWEIEFEFVDGVGDALDLSGATVTLRLTRRKLAVLTLTTADSPSAFTIGSPPLGEGLVSVAPELQGDLFAAVYDYRIFAELAGGEVTTQAFGTITVSA